MKPELFIPLGSGGIEVQSYVLFAALGAAAGGSTAFLLLKRRGLSVADALSLLLTMALSFLIGARLLNVLVNPAAYSGAQSVFAFRLAGLSFYGGVLGALTALMIWVRVKNRDPWVLLDALVLPAALAFALARVGCYLNGCCSGIPTDSFLGVAFPSGEDPPSLSRVLSLLGKKRQVITRHATQGYEAALALLGLIPVYWHRIRKTPPAGITFLLYGIWFSAMRLMILPLRSLPYSQWIQERFYPSFYLALIGVGILLVRWRFTRTKMEG